MKRIVVIAAITVFAGCSVGDFQMKRDAEKAMLANLKDPGSAQFRKMKVIEQSDGSKSVCGEVNAKNSMGGYVGYRLFAYVASSGSARMLPDNTDSVDDQLASVSVQMHCAGLIGKK